MPGLPNGTVISIGVQVFSPENCPCLHNFSDAKTLIQVVELTPLKGVVNPKDMVKDGTSGFPMSFFKICNEDIHYGFTLTYEQVGDAWYFHLVIVRWNYGTSPASYTIIYDDRQAVQYDSNGKILPPAWLTVPVSADGCNSSIDVSFNW